MAILDIILLLCFVPAIVSGISKGFVKQVVDLVAILIAAWAAFHFSKPLAAWLGTHITLDPTVLNVISFVLIAIVAALLLNLIASLITKAMQALSLGFLNRLLGLVFAVLKVGLILGLLIMLFETLNSSLHLVKPEVTENAVVYTTLRDIANQIFPILKTFVTGGTDAALFASGLLSTGVDIPVFTYSRRKNRFFDIRNAPFASDVPCSVSFSVEDCFLMAGGSVRDGRVDNSILSDYLPDVEPFFRLYMDHRRNWTQIVTFMQRISPASFDGTYSLDVTGGYTVKGEHGSRIGAPEEALRGMERIGFIQGLEIRPGESVSFRFRDDQTRAWLRDVGSVLELYVYKACLDAKLFDDVRTSTVVDWEGNDREHPVTNELDVMCTRGVTPFFISCKTCDVKTEALNELAILRDRFGGQIARAAIVTAEYGSSAMRSRATELGIQVIDLRDLASGRIGKRLFSLVASPSSSYLV